VDDYPNSSFHLRINPIVLMLICTFDTIGIVFKSTYGYGLVTTNKMFYQKFIIQAHICTVQMHLTISIKCAKYDFCGQGDSPYEKRQRTAVSDHVPIVGQAHGPSKDKMPIAGEAQVPSKDKITNPVTRLREPKPLALSDRDMIFNMGKSAVENKTTRRPGLQKEGSKVFGVPKPGKMKKFMDVSKHYVGDQVDKISEVSTSTRIPKQSVAQVRRPREGTLKLEQRAKRVGDMRSRGLKSAKSQNVSSNILPGKDLLSIPVPGSSALESSFAFAANATSSSNPVNPTVEKTNSAHSTDLITEDASVQDSSVHATPSVPNTKKKPTTMDRAKRKYVPSMDNNLNRRVLKTSEIPGQISSDSAEPRRSNRKIQPTSRVTTGTIHSATEYYSLVPNHCLNFV
jgi:hypothetical protein